MHLPGRFIDANYSRALLTHGDVTLAEALALDRVQKGLLPEEKTLRVLRKRKLVEGRKPALHISARVAAATGSQARYIRTRRQDDAHYRQLVLDYLRQFGEARRKDIDELLLDKLPDILSDSQKQNKIHNLLSGMRRDGQIQRRGGRSDARWHLVTRG